MDNYSKIYWLTRLDNVYGFAVLACAIGFVSLFIYYVIMYLDCFDDENRKKYKVKYSGTRKGSIWAICVSTVLLIFLPTKQDVMMIYAGGKTMDFVQSDTSLQKIPCQTTKLISDYLDRQINDYKEAEQK